MNKALIPAFFLLGSLILGVTVIVPQFASAQGEQKVNEKQIEALNLFFNGQNSLNTKGNEQAETLTSLNLTGNEPAKTLTLSDASQQLLQQEQEEHKTDDSSQSSTVESQINIQPTNNDNQQEVNQVSDQQITTSNNQQVLSDCACCNFCCTFSIFES